MSERIKLIVDRGRVSCPSRGRDVDVEECFACEQLEDADIDAKRPLVVCLARTRELRPLDA